MLVGCFEISISVIVKHVQNIGTIRTFCLSEGISEAFLPGRQKKLLDRSLLGVGISAQAETTILNFLFFPNSSIFSKLGFSNVGLRLYFNFFLNFLQLTD